MKLLKQTFVLLTLVFGLQALTHAAEADGYYIKRNNDTVHVTFNVPVTLFGGDIKMVVLQSKMKYVDSTGKTQRLSPDDAKEVFFVFKGEEIRMISCEKTAGLSASIFSSNNNIFLHLEIDGPLRLYTHYMNQQTPGQYNGTTWTGGYTYVNEKIVLQKKGKPLFEPFGLFFKREMTEYLSDCPELAQKIEKRILGIDNIQTIVAEYNYWYNQKMNGENNNKQTQSNK